VKHTLFCIEISIAHNYLFLFASAKLLFFLFFFQTNALFLYFCSMKSIINLIKNGRKLVADGAWGTFLYQKGLKTGDCPDEWTLSHPSDVEEVARSYVLADADIIETNSFGANRYKLEHYGLQDRVVEINRKAAELSRRVAGEERFVAASVGPTGKLLIMGDVSSEELTESFREQFTALEAGGADALCIETMTDVDEAVVAIHAAKQFTALETLCTFTFDKNPDGNYYTMMGATVEEAVGRALEAGADVVGANCGNGIERMTEITRLIKGAFPEAHILIQSNAGLPEFTGGQTLYPETPEVMASFVPSLLDAGADIIGGCCGTTPAHIAAIKRLVADYNNRQ
jgi:5-methyltetrahydrofolate--homocysteine methyltransferase